MTNLREPACSAPERPTLPTLRRKSPSTSESHNPKICFPFPARLVAAHNPFKHQSEPACSGFAGLRKNLKTMAYAKWPDTLDALVKEKSDVTNDGTTVKVSAEAIQYESSTDRERLHKMNDGLVVSQ